MSLADDREWLEPDGLGGFASGTVRGQRMRRYHALLLTATQPPTGRFVLVNGCEVQIETDSGTYALSTQQYLPNVIQPAGYRHLKEFTAEPWPTWLWQFPDGTQVRGELFVPHGASSVVLRWQLVQTSSKATNLRVRPLLSGRDYHALHHENHEFNFHTERQHDRLRWRPYQGVPGILLHTNGQFAQEPLWYRQFLYAAEQERGLDCAEDLASPGALRFDLNSAPAVCVFTVDQSASVIRRPQESVPQFAARLEQNERDRRNRFATPLDRAADAFIVQRGSGTTILAGYPWFTDWGRDTFISLRGLCLATGRLEAASRILEDWAGLVSEGMLPNRFADQPGQLEYNSVDASLWFVIAAHDYLQSAARTGRLVTAAERQKLMIAIEQILSGFQKGTRFGIRADDDGLLRAGEPGVQLTWMDAKVGDWIVTPRIGKPVEVQALWINALWIASRLESHWKAKHDLALRSFRDKFWNKELNCLYDVVDANHVAGTHDAAVRPNQIFSVGGLPRCLLEKEQAKAVVQIVEDRLYTPLGLRTLDPASPDYRPQYRGGPRERDGAYHQGTAWPWLLGPFVEAWVRVRGETDDARREAAERFLPPLREHLHEAGIGHISEIVDGQPGDTPQGPRHRPGGCPFQAWSLGELLRLERDVLSVDRPEKSPMVSEITPFHDVELPETITFAQPKPQRRKS